MERSGMRVSLHALVGQPVSLLGLGRSSYRLTYWVSVL
jgi:hypothetical protein